MSQFSQVRGGLSDAAFQQMQANISRALAVSDYDSGWVATPADKQFEHNLGDIPKFVFVFAADDPEAAATPDSYVSVDRQFITIIGPKAFARVLIDL
jgi:hypothetical protein